MSPSADTDTGIWYWITGTELGELTSRKMSVYDLPPYIYREMIMLMLWIWIMQLKTFLLVTVLFFLF